MTNVNDRCFRRKVKNFEVTKKSLILYWPVKISKKFRKFSQPKKEKSKNRKKNRELKNETFSWFSKKSEKMLSKGNITIDVQSHRGNGSISIFNYNSSSI